MGRAKALYLIELGLATTMWYPVKKRNSIFRQKSLAQKKCGILISTINLAKETNFSRNGTGNDRISPVKNKIEKPNSRKRIGLLKNSWQRPTLPYSYPYSTIGPAGLVCSVRNGKRNFTRGIVARKNIKKSSRS
jgi:hypothetical protein